jgi:uncharacterized protein (TIGR02147 family)
MFDQLKLDDPTFSFRSFARMACSTSPNFLQLILNRKLNISNAALFALSAALKLSKGEEEYFEAIVNFDHAKTNVEKDKFFKRILQTRQSGGKVQTLLKEQYEYFSHWYIPVIRELIVSKAYPGDPEWITKKITPQVTVSQVQKGIALLEKLGLIVSQGENRLWSQKNSVISTESEVVSLAVAQYHKNMIALAGESIERFDPSSRDIRSITLGVSESGYAEIKKRLEEFWIELLHLADTQKDINRVFQVNMQLFPLSNSTTDDTNEK